MPGAICTSSHPSAPKLSKICLAACVRIGAVRYSHFVMLGTLLGEDPGSTRGRTRAPRPATRVAGVTPEREHHHPWRLSRQGQVWFDVALATALLLPALALPFTDAGWT